jgi:hypothetical protein
MDIPVATEYHIYSLSSCVNGIVRARAQEIEQRKVSRHKAFGIKVTNECISALFAMPDYKMEVVIEDLFEIKRTSEDKLQPAGTRNTISIL